MKYILIIITCINFLYAAPRQLYSIQDLEVLESNNNFREFFQHALDIRPSRRNSTWSEMCMNMAQAYMSDLRSNGISAKDREALLQVLKYPTLKRDEFFIEKRDQFLAYMLGDYAQKNNSETTMKFASEVFEQFRGKPILGILITTNLYPKIKAKKEHLKHLDFFKDITSQMMKSKFSEFYCGKEPIDEMLVDQIFYQNLNPKDIHKDCMSKLLPRLEKTLYSDNNQKRNIAYKFLAKNKYLKPKDEAYYHTLNLLYGKKLNKSEWDPVIRSLKILGENHPYRQKIMNKITKADPYPDLMFKVYSEKQLISLTRLLARYFPEYLDRYALDCLDYLSGKRKFKNGNPTPHCHRYMQISTRSKSSPVQVLERYDDIVNGWKKN